MNVDDVFRQNDAIRLRPRLPQSIQELHESTLREHEAVDAGEPGPSFGAMLRDGLQSVSDQSQQVQDKLKGLVTGETESVHEVLSAMGQSEVQFELLLQVRNKLIDAWQQISQIRV